MPADILRDGRPGELDGKTFFEDKEIIMSALQEQRAVLHCGAVPAKSGIIKTRFQLQ